MTARNRSHRTCSVIAVLLGLALWACTGPAIGHQDGVARSQTESATALSNRLVAGNTQFALELHHALSGAAGNLFFSPYSISAALAMAYAGARGETERQMAEALHFTLPQDDLHRTFANLASDLGQRADAADGIELTIANSLWGQDGHTFLDEFLDLIETSYGAPLRSADFAGAPERACSDINTWVREMTAGRIPELMGPGSIMPDTRLILANAIHFLGAWKIEFNEEMTWDRTFHLLDGSEIPVPTMYAEDQFGYTEGDGYQAAELRYSGDEFSMVILLPDEGTFETFEANLDAVKLSGILGRMGLWDVHLAMPRFELTSEFSLAAALAGLGMADAFSGSADFSGMDGGRDLFIDGVVHKAFVSVTEEGTEAAAATALMMRTSIRRVPYFTMRINRPFLFLIRDRVTGTILFMGRVLDPRAG